MKLKVAVFNSLRYIEKNINESITAEDIANNAGYSLYYFSRVFKEEIGLSIMEYVKERRMIKASEEIANGKKIIDTALDYGYQSHSGFTKAFKNKFGFSPELLRAFRFQINCLGGNYNMSHIFMKNTDIHAAKEKLYELLKNIIDENKLEYDKKKLAKTYEFACKAYDGRKRHSGDEYITHPLNVAILLTEMEANEDTVAAGLLHDVTSLEEVKKEFPERVVKIIMEAAKFNESTTDEDVIMVKLADRIHNMRTIQFIDEAKWKKKAEETLDIFSPMAARLKNEKVIAELNDLSMKYV